MSLLLGALLIFCLRICDVTLGTLRVIFVVNGRRGPAMGLAFIESLIYISAISQVFQHLDHWQNIVGFACGYACGTMVGITADQLIGIGQAVVRIITREPGSHLRERLAAQGYGVTAFQGEGVAGPVQELIVVIPRRWRSRLVAHVRAVDPHAFVTIETASRTFGGYHATGGSVPARMPPAAGELPALPAQRAAA